jgi:hypothetical protein
MKILIFLFSCCFIMSFSGCIAVTKPPDQVELLEVDAGRHLLGIAIERSGALLPRSGGIMGYDASSYWAELEGSGPIFVNPPFVGGSGEPCIGTITLDREHSEVTIKLRRIVSAPGEPLKTKPHPANGTYKINTVRKANFYEKWF